MIELLIIFQVQVDKKTTTVNDIIIPVPYGLEHREVLRIVKESIATIEGAGAILNIINMNVMNPPKVKPVKESAGREHSSFALRRAETGRHGARKAERRSPKRYESPREGDGSPRENGRGGFRGKEGGFKSKEGSFRGKPAGGAFRGKSGRSSRPSRSK